MDHRFGAGLGNRLSLGCLGVAVLLSAALLAIRPSTASASGGAAVAWGENDHGQLGAIFRSLREESPIAVEGIDDITAIAATPSFDLALLGDGTVASWGSNVHGQLGDGGERDSWEEGQSHVFVGGLTGVRGIAAANEHALALLANGTVRAWGNNLYGQLGDGTAGFESQTGVNQRVPQVVDGLTDAIAVAAGGASDYAILANHTVMAWGSNTKGQLGIGRSGPQYCESEVGRGRRTEACSTLPLPVETAAGTPLEHVVAIAAGGQAAYALLEDGRVMSWGSNSKGQLGRLGIPVGARAKDNPPGEVTDGDGEPLSGVVAVSAGAGHVLALLNEKRVVGWGDTEQGDLGEVGTARCGGVTCERTATPIRALEGLDVEAVAAAERYSLVLSGGQVYAFGRNQQGQLGDGGACENAGGTLGRFGTCYSRVPTVVPGLERVSAIAAAGGHAVALLASGAEPPLPLLTVQSAERELDVVGPTGGIRRLLWRAFAGVAAPEAEGESGEGEGVEAGEGEGRGRTERLKPPAGADGAVIDELYGSPLQAIPYEVKIETGKLADRKARRDAAAVAGRIGAPKL
jgi:alpha-tubulin suppressor-like RCC1 family protein